MTTVALDIETLPIHSDPEILGGVTVFMGTRVPIRTFFEYIEDGCSLDEFLDQFPSVKRGDAITLLETASNTFLKATLSK
ncbi:MAG: DUF433 domain-containing protein [Planctomycetota bacterium]